MRQTACILRDDAFAFKVRRHAQQLPNGDDARATHAAHHHAPGLPIERLGHNGRRQGSHNKRRRHGLRLARVGRLVFLELPALDGDEAGAKPFHTRNVFVAGALVDLPFAAKFGFEWLHAQAIALHAAIATAFTDQLIDDDAFGRVHHGAAFAAPALFSGASLVVNDDGAALDPTQLLLRGIQRVAVAHRDALGQRHALVFFGLVGDHHNFGGSLGPHGHGDLHHRVPFGPLADLLPTGHRNRVVVQNLVGDVHACRDGLAHGQQAAVEISAITQVGKHMLVVAKRLLPDPRHALAAHLGKTGRAAIHPDGHEMAANTGHGPRSFRHFGGCVVRTTRAEPGLAIGTFQAADLQDLHGRFFGIQDGQVCIHACASICINPQFFQAQGNGPGNQGGRQIGVGAQQAVGHGIGHGPFATFGFVEFAHHHRANVCTPVIELFLELVFNDLAFLFDDHDFFEAGGEFTG